MTDMFENHSESLSTPPAYAMAVVPDDNTDLPVASRAINAAASGTVRVTTVRGDTIDLFVAAGGLFPIRAARIHASGTTATGLVALY